MFVQKLFITEVITLFGCRDRLPGKTKKKFFCVLYQSELSSNINKQINTFTMGPPLKYSSLDSIISVDGN